MSVGWMGIRYLPVGIAGCIGSMSSIMGPIWGRIFLKESMSKFDILALLSAFIGIVLINNPFG